MEKNYDSIMKKVKGNTWLNVKDTFSTDVAFIGKGKNLYSLVVYSWKDNRTNRPFQGFYIEKVVLNDTSISDIKLIKENKNTKTWFGKSGVARFKVMKGKKKIGYILLKKAGKESATSTLRKLYRYFVTKNAETNRHRFYAAKTGSEIMVENPDIYFTYFKGYLAYLYWRPLTIYNRYKLFEIAISTK